MTFTPSVAWEPNTTYTIALTSGLKDISGNGLTNPGTITFTTGADTDTIAPSIAAYSPGYGDSNVGLHPIVRVTFSEPVNPISIGSPTFYLYNSNFGVLVPATVLVAPDRLSATLTPTGELAPYTSYYFQIYNVADLAGNYGGGVFVIFTTGGVTDTSAPAVVSIAPANAAGDVPVNALVQMVMNEPIDPTSIGNSTVQLTPGVGGTVALLGDRVTIRFTPSTPLSPSLSYSVNVAGVRDLSGNAMTPFVSTFTTSSSTTPDTTAPTVVSFDPVSNATDVAVNAPISMTLSEPIDPAHLGSNSMRVYAIFPSYGSVQVAGTYQLTGSGTVATFTPSAPYPTGTQFYAYSNYDGSIADFAGNALQSTYTFFTTAGAPPDTSSPTVVSVTPIDGATGVGPNAVVTLTFSESMNPAVYPYSTFGVFAGATPIGFSVSRSTDNRMALLSGTWPLNTLMTVVATGDNADLSGNHLTPFSSTFTTAAAFDPNRPSIVTQLPTGSGVSRNAIVTLYANKPLNPATVPGALFVSQNGVLVDGDVTVSGNGTAITFVPAGPFAGAAVIQIFVTAAAQDTFGNSLQFVQRILRGRSGSDDHRAGYRPHDASDECSSGIRGIGSSKSNSANRWIRRR